MRTVTRQRLLEAYASVDLFRAKYRHSDFTPHAWCFHGNQAQGWQGQCEERMLTIIGSTQRSVDIDTSLYKYISFRLHIPSHWERRATPTSLFVRETRPMGVQYLSVLSYFKEDGTHYTKETILEKSREQIFYDMSTDPMWSGRITNIRISIEAIGSQASLIRTISSLEYFKVDQKDMFSEVFDDRTVNARDINRLREEIDIITKRPVDWGIRGSSDDRIKAFIDSIRSEHTEIIDTVENTSPYNGCNTCDNFQCSCHRIAHGHVGCRTCDGCNAFVPCNRCDFACHTEAVACTCNRVCHSEARACTCDRTCFQTFVRSCSCDGDRGCQGCNRCDRNQTNSCSSDGRCDCFNSVVQINCSFCDKNSDTGCRVGSYTSGGGTCSCNSTCHAQCASCHTCNGKAHHCTGCDAGVSCNSGFGACATCDSGNRNSPCSCDTNKTTTSTSPPATTTTTGGTRIISAAESAWRKANGW